MSVCLCVGFEMCEFLFEGMCRYCRGYCLLHYLADLMVIAIASAHGAAVGSKQGPIRNMYTYVYNIYYIYIYTHVAYAITQTYMYIYAERERQCQLF